MTTAVSKELIFLQEAHKNRERVDELDHASRRNCLRSQYFGQI